MCSSSGVESSPLPLVGSVRKVFLVHGEPQQSETLAKLLKSQYNLETVAPAPGQGFELSS